MIHNIRIFAHWAGLESFVAFSDDKNSKGSEAIKIKNDSCARENMRKHKEIHLGRGKNGEC